ncbi:hypothetical protein ACFC09_18570 [Streptomyces sp. NPDC056161]|uniref:MmyB family transcriptional regulator n=1 Tax=Streptomyces sp. NPDC056161 TaxID=3345732 RepID=UPI0035E3AE20
MSPDWDPPASAVLTDFAAVPRRERNFMRMLFLDAHLRGCYVDWPPLARTCVGFFRAALGDGAGEPRLAELIGELSLRDRDFRTWWASRSVSHQTFGTKTLRHPEAGRFSLDWQVLHSAHDDQATMVMTAPPDGGTLDVIRRLAPGSAPRASVVSPADPSPDARPDRRW